MNLEHHRPYLAETEIAEVFRIHQLSWEFHCEVTNRDRHRQYCQWYREVARQHQEEFARMQKETGIWQWFLRR